MNYQSYDCYEIFFNKCEQKYEEKCIIAFDPKKQSRADNVYKTKLSLFF